MSAIDSIQKECLKHQIILNKDLKATPLMAAPTLNEEFFKNKISEELTKNFHKFQNKIGDIKNIINLFKDNTLKNNLNDLLNKKIYKNNISDVLDTIKLINNLDNIDKNTQQIKNIQNKIFLTNENLLAINNAQKGEAAQIYKLHRDLIYDSEEFNKYIETPRIHDKLEVIRKYFQDKVDKDNNPEDEETLSVLEIIREYFIQRNAINNINKKSQFPNVSNLLTIKQWKEEFNIFFNQQTIAKKEEILKNCYDEFNSLHLIEKYIANIFKTYNNLEEYKNIDFFKDYDKTECKFREDLLDQSKDNILNLQNTDNIFNITIKIIKYINSNRIDFQDKLKFIKNIKNQYDDNNLKLIPQLFDAALKAKHPDDINDIKKSISFNKHLAITLAVTAAIMLTISCLALATIFAPTALITLPLLSGMLAKGIALGSALLLGSVSLAGSRSYFKKVDSEQQQFENKQLKTNRG